MLRFRKKDGSNYPDWIEHRIDEIFSLTRGYVIPVSELSTEPNDEYCFPVYSSQTKNNGLMGYYNRSLYENAITWTTDGANAGTTKFRKGKFYCSNVCGVLLNQDGFANQCIAEMINEVSKRYVTYGGNPKLMNNVMAAIKIKFPCLEEQQKIADCFLSVDTVITDYEAQVKNMVNQKKGIMQKLFSQEVRFKADDGSEYSEWKKRTLRDGFYIKARIGWQALTKAEYLSEGDYYLVTGTDIMPNHTVNLNTCHFVSKERYEMDDAIQLQEGDVIVTKDGTIGKVAQITKFDKPATLNSHLFLIRDEKKTVINRFLLYLLTSPLFDEFVAKTRMGGTLTGLPQKALIEFSFDEPCIEEQQKIADCLSAFDDTIEDLQKTVEHWKNIKKGLLQQLFA